MTVLILSALLALPPLQTVSPGPPRIGMVAYLQAGFAGISRSLIDAAALMPEAGYGFKPSQMDAARPFGAVIAHAADGMFGACARARGTANPRPGLEQSLTAKTDIAQALAESVAYCEAVFSALTEETATEFVRQGPVQIPRAAALMGVLAHNAEMFGISTVYLRARNVVPPGSDRD